MSEPKELLYSVMQTRSHRVGITRRGSPMASASCRHQCQFVFVLAEKLLAAEQLRRPRRVDHNTYVFGDATMEGTAAKRFCWPVVRVEQADRSLPTTTASH